MKILFIEPNIRSQALLPSLSLPALKGYLTQQTGHHATILDLIFHKQDWQDHILTALTTEQPDLIGISILSFDYDDALMIARFIKDHTQAPIIFGGVHAILSPDDVIQHPQVDMVCTGEGEHTLKDLLDNNLDPKDITGLWYKHNGAVIKNPPRPLIEDLDSLGFQDFTDFDIPRYLFINHHHMPIMASRGCPYSCTYCSNHALRKTLQGRYVRFRTVNHVMRELELRTKQYKDLGMRFLYFFDDTFILDPQYINDFCTAYKEAGYHHWLHWSANIRANLVTADLMRTMKDAGCYQVRMGIESGSETLRNTVYNRNMTNTQIHTAFTTIHNADLLLRLYFMVGAPQETTAMMQESLQLAQQSGADDFYFSILYPLPGTEIQQACRQAKTLGTSHEESLGTIPITHTLTVTPRELKHFMRRVEHWQIQKYFTDGLHLKGPRHLLDCLWFTLYLKHAYDLEPTQIFLWNIQRYKLERIQQHPA